MHARDVVAAALGGLDGLADQRITHLLGFALRPRLVCAQVGRTVLLTLIHGGRRDHDEKGSRALPYDSRPDDEVAHVATLQVSNCEGAVACRNSPSANCGKM
jgi:hypothetical protein